MWSVEISAISVYFARAVGTIAAFFFAISIGELIMWIKLKVTVKVMLLAILSVSFLGSCASTGEVSSNGWDVNELNSVLAGVQRYKEDKSRDAARKPAEVITFFGVEPGMTAMDYFAAGGWYTEVLSNAVGAGGKVYSQNLPSYLVMREGAAEKAISARLANDRLANVTRVDADLKDVPIPAGTVDVIVTALNLHDLYYMMSPEVLATSLNNFKSLLAPGGVLGIIDHVGSPDGNNKQLHRIDPNLLIKYVEEAGFKIEARSEILSNANDDHTSGVFSPGIRGNTDRFLLRARKL